MPQDNSRMDTGALPKLHLEIKDSKHDSLNLLHGGSGKLMLSSMKHQHRE